MTSTRDGVTGETFIVYTTRDNDTLRVMKGTEDTYKDLLRNHSHYYHFIAFVRAEKNFDFLLGRPRHLTLWEKIKAA